MPHLSTSHSADWFYFVTEITLDVFIFRLLFNMTRYTLPMISTFGDKETALVFQGVFVRSLPRPVQMMARRKLLMIDAAKSISDMFAPPGNGLELLQGDRSGQWSVRINAQWRICFHFIDGDELDVEIVDSH
jgi:proteic killer suppression protein